jgi:hypothetical protein
MRISLTVSTKSIPSQLYLQLPTRLYKHLLDNTLPGGQPDVETQMLSCLPAFMMRFLGEIKPQCHTCRPRVTVTIYLRTSPLHSGTYSLNRFLVP